MPGIVKETAWSSASDSASSSDNEAWGAEPSFNGHEYVAASFPGYKEKPLAEQLEPIAVCGMGMFPPTVLNLDSQMLRRVPSAWRCNFSSWILGDDA